MCVCMPIMVATREMFMNLKEKRVFGVKKGKR